jgi:hypothetical protein
MKKTKQTNKNASQAKRKRVVRSGICACILLAAAAVTTIAKYVPMSNDASHEKQKSSVVLQPASNYVTVEVGGKKLKVNAQTLQQGPLTQEQARQMADALAGNKSTDGLVQVEHSDGTVSVDLQDRFQNVMLAKKNDDGSISQACVDNPVSAATFLSSGGTNSGTDTNRKVTAKE